MDQTLLVEHEIEDAPRLITELRKANVVPRAAFWLYSNESGDWNLYLVVDGIKERGGRSEYMAMHKLIGRMDDFWIDRFAVTFIDSDDPLAKAVLDHLSTRQTKIPTRVRNARLGDVFVDAAYIYPNAVIAGT